MTMQPPTLMADGGRQVYETVRPALRPVPRVAATAIQGVPAG